VKLIALIKTSSQYKNEGQETKRNNCRYAFRHGRFSDSVAGDDCQNPEGRLGVISF
jgi:hypothetical protein